MSELVLIFTLLGAVTALATLANRLRDKELVVWHNETGREQARRSHDGEVFELQFDADTWASDGAAHGGELAAGAAAHLVHPGDLVILISYGNGFERALVTALVSAPVSASLLQLCPWACACSLVVRYGLIGGAMRPGTSTSLASISIQPSVLGSPGRRGRPAPRPRGAP